MIQRKIGRNHSIVILRSRVIDKILLASYILAVELGLGRKETAVEEGIHISVNVHRREIAVADAEEI